MDSFRSWVITICAGVIFITAVEIILPDNSLKKYAKFVLGLILMTAIINPIVKFFTGGYINVSSYLNDYQNIIENEEKKSQSNDEVNLNNTKKVFEKNIENIVMSALKNDYPKDTFEVEVNTEYNKEENLFSINKVIIKYNKGGIRTVQKIPKVQIGKDEQEGEEEQEIDDKDMKSLIAKTLNVKTQAIHIHGQDK